MTTNWPKMSKNYVFGLKIAISWATVTLRIATINIRATPKNFFGTLQIPY